MADTEAKNLEALEAEAVAEATVADAPKKNAVAAEPTHLSNEAEDLGPAVVKPTDSNPDATKKTKQVSGDAQQKSQGAADPMPKLKEEQEETEDAGEVVQEGEMPAGLKKYLDKKADKKDGDKEEGYGMKAASYKKDMKKEEIDVTEHVDALIAGESDLSEEFKNKAATIFESAIKSKVREIEEHLEVEYNNKFEQETAKHKEELTEKVDSYLSYVVEEWMKENEIALERGIKGEIAEDFIGGLKQLFEDHYIDIPDEKYDILEAKEQEIEELKSKVNEMTNQAVDMKKQINEFSKDDILEEVTSGLADTEVEKLKSLIEDVSYEGADEYKKKLTTIKESYFGNAKSAPASTTNVDATNSEDGNTVSDPSDSMARYTAAISRVKSRDIYNN